MRKAFFLTLLLFVSATAVVARPFETQEPATLFLKGYRAHCETVVPRKCLVVRKAGEEEYRLFYDEIENFDFVPGFEYELKVRIEKLDAAPKDTSGYRYFLKEVVSRVEMSDSEDSIHLFGNKWRLISVDGRQVGASGAYIVFSGTDEGVYGGTGCNSFNGSYRIEGSRLHLSPLAMTMRACPDKGSEEGDLMKALRSADSLKIEPDRLYIFSEGAASLVFATFE
jgi:heat shock protein HslJ